MKRTLGFSIYPQHSTLEKDKEYIDLAVQYNFSRMFTCLLSVGENKKEAFNHFKDIVAYATSKGIEVFFDVDAKVFKDFNINANDLSWIKELKASGIRLDSGFDGLEVATQSYNPYGLYVELNMSNDTYYLDNIFSHQPNLHTLMGCHNFYPQKYTGLSYDYFISCSQRYKKHGLRTAAFVSSQVASLGPWSINDGLCTLEQHRNIPITTQAKELWATGLIDDVIIGNAYASEEELRQLSQIDPYTICLDVEVSSNITEYEKSILFDTLHVRRGDISDYMIRSTEIRKKHVHSHIPALELSEQRYGEVYIGNNNFGKYKGELQIITQDMPADNRKNKVAIIKKHDQCLIPYLSSWKKFKFN